MQTLEKMHGNLISTTSKISDACLHIPTQAMRQDLANLLTQAQEQLKVLGEAIPAEDAV